MHWKLLVIDLDGTLLSKFNKISKKNIQAIKNYTKNGGQIAIATGRSLSKCLDVVNDLYKQTNYLIKYVCCFNGALIYDVVNQQILQQAKISSEIVKKIHHFTTENNLGFWPYDEKYLSQSILKIDNIRYKWLLKYFYKGYQINSFKKTDNIIEEYNNVYKVNVIPKTLTKRLDNQIYLDLKQQLDDVVEVCFTNNFVIEMTSKNISKKNAIDYFSNIYNIDKQNIATIGDSSNDIPMFKESGLSVAAKIKSKNIVKYVDLIMHKKNNKNSVAKLINNYLLKNNVLSKKT